MRILHVIRSVDAASGGPIEGVRKIGAEVRSRGHVSEVVSLDAPDARCVLEFDGVVHPLGPSIGNYGYSPRLIPWLKSNSAGYDAVIVNGIWQYHSFAAWRALAGLDKPYFVFTHGMLDPWFKRTYPLKHLKKWLYWPWSEYRLLRDARAVLFTCEEERRLARESFWLYRATEVVASYGTADAPCDSEALADKFFSVHPHLRGKRIALFLSRIHEKKGCDLLIEAYAQVAKTRPDLHLVIAGPDQTGWVPRLQALAARHGVAERISWPGMLSGEMKWGAFHAAEVFCLPSHQENFGIVVAEALACSKPVLISDKVNIWREIQEDAAGFVQSDTLDGTIRAMEQWLSMSRDEARTMQLAARRCFEGRFRIEKVAEDLLDIIGSRLGQPEAEATAKGAL